MGRLVVAAILIVLVAGVAWGEESVDDFLRLLCVDRMDLLRNPTGYMRPTGEWVEVTAKDIEVGANDGSVLVGMVVVSANSRRTFYLDDLNASAGKMANAGGEDGTWRDLVTSRGDLTGAGRTTEKAHSGKASIVCATAKNMVVDADIMHVNTPCNPVPCPTHADGSKHSFSSGAITELEGLNKDGEKISLSAWIHIPEGLYTVIADGEHNHRTDAPLFFCVDANDDGVIDLPEELFGTMQMDDVRRHARRKAAKMRGYRDSLGEDKAEERNKAELLEAYMWNVGLEHAKADAILVKHIARLEAEGTRDERYRELLMLHGLITQTLGDTAGALGTFDKVKELGETREANSHIAIASEKNPAAVYEYAEAHPGIYGEWSFVASLSRVFFDYTYGGSPREEEGMAEIPEDPEKTKAILRIIYKLDFEKAKTDPTLGKRWKYEGTAEWQEGTVRWAGKALESLGVEESKIRRFMRYKLGKSDGTVEMEELGL
jgi:hypothetical protein